MSAQQQSIQPFTPKDYDALTKKFEHNPVSGPNKLGKLGAHSCRQVRWWIKAAAAPTIAVAAASLGWFAMLILPLPFPAAPQVAMQFITLYSYEDIVTARIEGSSGSLWSISPPSRDQLWRELRNSSSDITLRLTWSFQRYNRPHLCCVQGVSCHRGGHKASKTYSTLPFSPSFPSQGPWQRGHSGVHI